MIGFVNSWMKGIILAVIITIIIEMLLPEGKNKKYIKTIISLYIVYVMIAPIISKVFNKTINIEEVFTKYNIPETNIVKIDNNKIIKDTYEQTIKKDIKDNLLKLGYNTHEMDVYINTKDESYGEIEKIRLSVEKVSNKSIKAVEKIEINKNVKEQKANITEEDKKVIINYLITNYGVSETNIIVNNEE